MRDYKPQSQKTRVEKLLQSFAQTPLGGRLFITVFPAIDKRLMPITRGRLSTGMGQPVVLLHVRGAKSGIERTVPLLATKTGDAVLVVASKAGAPKHPAWYHNLRANPEVKVFLRGRTGRYRARVAQGAERERLWKVATTLNPGYDIYAKRASNRQIPVVALSPTA